MAVPSAVEIVAVVFSLAAVWLTVRKNIWCWPVGLVGVTAYAVFFLDLRLYADLGLQSVFFVQGLYGWWFWIRGGDGPVEPAVTRIGGLPFLGTLAGLLAGAFLLGRLLALHTNAAVPYLDAFLALTSLTANMLLARKVLESWWFWITADVLYIGLFWIKDAHLSAALYAVFLGMAIHGALRWHSEMPALPARLRAAS